MTGVSISVGLRGPLFDGGANAALDSFARDLDETLANQAQSIIRDKALRMNKSGRGGTGVAAAHVIKRNEGGSWFVIGDSAEGEVWWPWLEGVSRRNFTTRFKGYHAFRLAAAIVNKRAERVGNEVLQKFLPALGGD